MTTRPDRVRLTGRQAEYIEYAAEDGGQLITSASPYGSAEVEYRTINALVGKGILRLGRCVDRYNVEFRLTPDGWAVYATHPKVIRRVPVSPACGTCRAPEAVWDRHDRLYLAGGSTCPPCTRAEIKLDTRFRRAAE